MSRFRWLVPLVSVSGLFACVGVAFSAPEAPLPGAESSQLPAVAERLLLAESEPLLAPGTAAARALEQERDDVLVAAVRQRFVTAEVRISDAEVEAFYSAHRAEFAGSDRLILRHIFRRISVRAPEIERQRLRAELEALRREVLAGADLAALAHARSDSQTARFGGLIAPQARGQLEPTIEARVWRLAVGELSEVVETPIGFHVFRLEQRLPPQDIDPATARTVSRRKLTLAAEAVARERLFTNLLRESGALWAPHRLEAQPIPSALLFRLGAEQMTVADLERSMAELSFLEQRTRRPLDVLRERAERVLWLWKAGRERLAAAEDVAPRLVEADRVARLDAAIAARLARRRDGLEDAVLRPFFDAQPARFALPARYRLHILMRSFAPEHSAHYYFEELSALAREIRAGRREFATAARELSTDRSSVSGGDLGWIDLRDFGWWAGTTAYERVRRLAAGAVSDPLLVEVYDAEQLTDHARGYMLVRVEAVELRRNRTFVEARADVAAAWIAAHLEQLRREIEAGLASVPALQSEP